MEFRPYQKECLDIINSTESGSWLVVLATGLGKTVIFTHIKRRGRVLILSHREELVYQPQKYYEGVSFGVEKAGKTSNGEEVVSASVQTLVRRLDKFEPDDFDMIITDEAHHAVAKTYRKIYDYFKPRIHIGFTATPKRSDNIGLRNIFDGILYQKDLQWGITHGYLTDLHCKMVDIDYDLNKIKTRRGDYDQKSLYNAIDEDKKNTGVALAYKDLAVGQTLIFAGNIRHTKNLVRKINELCGKGTAEGITGKTDNREQILDKFRNKEIKCLVNCMVLTEGTDLPMIETLIIARPTQNEGLYTQMVGRALRLYEGKEKAYLIECVGNDVDVRQCTASSLMGYDLSVLPENKRKNVEGPLMKLNEVIEDLAFDPEVFQVTFHEFALYEKAKNRNVHGINYYEMKDGSLHCDIGTGETLIISKKNRFGKCMVLFEKRNGYLDTIEDNLTKEQALSLVEEILKNDYKDKICIWNARIRSRWGNDKASKPQINKLRGYQNQEWFRKNHKDDIIDFDNLTKGRASMLIDRFERERNSMK